jgi:hypothetical protein
VNTKEGPPPLPWAVEDLPGGQNIPVRVFLPNLQVWKEAGMSITILQWIHCRVPLPLQSIPRLCIILNHHLTIAQQLWVKEEIKQLLDLQAIWVLAGNEPLMSSLIGVVQKENGKF